MKSLRIVLLIGIAVMRQVHAKDENSTRIMLIGLTGAGKSTLGNRLLSRDAFLVGGGYDSVTQAVQCEFGVIGRRKIEVCDTPGLNDDSDAETIDLIFESIAKKQTHGIVFVHSAAEVRLTKAARKALRLVLRDLGSAQAIESRLLFVLTRSTGLKAPPKTALSDALCRKLHAFCSSPLPSIAYAGTLNPLLDSFTLVRLRFRKRLTSYLDTLLSLDDHIRPIAIPSSRKNQLNEKDRQAPASPTCPQLLTACQQKLRQLQ